MVTNPGTQLVKARARIEELERTIEQYKIGIEDSAKRCDRLEHELSILRNQKGEVAELIRTNAKLVHQNRRLLDRLKSKPSDLNDELERFTKGFGYGK